ncbi:MAG: ABC transporter substrate-binding protein [Piscinibacter sp.]|nr:ABC transporter substrate-binding protein [Piscinibacter sp.]
MSRTQDNPSASNVDAPRVGPGASTAASPEKQEVRIGFMPLTDCAPVIMASVLGFDRKHGVKIVPTRESSWAGVRDKLVSGELDMAQALYGLVYGTHLGVGGPKKDMAVLMTINQNGQGLTLSRALAERGAVDAASLARLMAAEPRPYTFAQTFPTGTHAMWLYYWLASAGINPMTDAKVITVPPPQMVANMRVGNVDGFSVGEPWNHRAIIDGIGVHAASSQDVWKDHPEKVLGCTADFAAAHPATARAVVMALLEASRWIDASEENKTRMAETIAAPQYVNVAAEAILPRILGRYQDGIGRTWTDPDHMAFFRDGEVNFPYLSDGMWFLTQYRRWGLLRAHPDYLDVATRVNRLDIYRDAAGALGIALPRSPLRSSRLIDGAVWDGTQPASYADSFSVRAPVPALDVA